MTNLRYIEDVPTRNALLFLLDHREHMLEAATYQRLDTDGGATSEFNYQTYQGLPEHLKNEYEFRVVERSEHLDWLMDQFVRILLVSDDAYDAWKKISHARRKEDGVRLWSVGTPPIGADEQSFWTYVPAPLKEGESSEDIFIRWNLIDSIEYFWRQQDAARQRWVFDNIVRVVAGNYYRRFVDDYQYDENLNKRYVWNMGIPA